MNQCRIRIQKTLTEIHTRSKRNCGRTFYEIFSLAGLSIGIIISTGFGFGLNGSFPFLAFLQIPLIQLLLHRHNRAINIWIWTILKFILIWISTTLGYTIGYAYSFPIETSPIIVLGLAAALGLLQIIFIYLPAYRLWRLFESRMIGWKFVTLTTALPILYTALWFLFPMILPIGDFSHPAYSQVDVRSVMMFASVFGISGISFILSWTGMGIFVIISANENRIAQKTLLAKTIVITFIIITTCGSLQSLLANGNFYQQDNGRTPAVQHKIGCLLSGNFDSTKQFLQTHSNYSLIVWSELSSYMDDNTTVNLQALAKFHNVSIVTAYYRSGDQYNWAALIDNEGTLKYSYKKRHPVPGVETSTPGPGEIYVADTNIGKISTAICFDLDFPSYINTVPRSAEYLVQPSDTWGAIGEYHAKINAVRSIEHGFTLIRCSSVGYSGVFTPDGKWLSFFPDDYHSAYSMILADPPKRVFTVYDIIGDVFAWICVGLSVVVIVASVVPLSVHSKIRHKFSKERRYQLVNDDI